MHNNDDDDGTTTTTTTSSGKYHVIVTDLREELVIYINGTAFLRRELEMPAAALHHAGIQASRLEDLERRLLADVAAEAEGWGGKILLHREVMVLPSTPTTSTNAHIPSSNQGVEMSSVSRPAVGGLFSPAGPPSPYMTESTTTTTPPSSHSKQKKDKEEEEDITQTTEAQEKTKPAVQVVAFWEPVVVPSLPFSSSSVDTGTTTGGGGTNRVGGAY